MPVRSALNIKNGDGMLPLDLALPEVESRVRAIVAKVYINFHFESDLVSLDKVKDQSGTVVDGVFFVDRHGKVYWHESAADREASFVGTFQGCKLRQHDSGSYVPDTAAGCIDFEAVNSEDEDEEEEKEEEEDDDDEGTASEDDEELDDCILMGERIELVPATYLFDEDKQPLEGEHSINQENQNVYDSDGNFAGRYCGTLTKKGDGVRGYKAATYTTYTWDHGTKNRTRIRVEAGYVDESVGEHDPYVPAPASAKQSRVGNSGAWS